MTGATKLFHSAVGAEDVPYELQHGTDFLDALPRLVNRPDFTIAQTRRSRPQLLLDDTVQTSADGLIVP
jgi:hypothetical protein